MLEACLLQALDSGNPVFQVFFSENLRCANSAREIIREIIADDFAIPVEFEGRDDSKTVKRSFIKLLNGAVVEMFNSARCDPAKMNEFLVFDMDAAGRFFLNALRLTASATGSGGEHGDDETNGDK